MQDSLPHQIVENYQDAAVMYLNRVKKNFKGYVKMPFSFCQYRSVEHLRCVVQANCPHRVVQGLRGVAEELASVRERQLQDRAIMEPQWL